MNHEDFDLLTAALDSLMDLPEQHQDAFLQQWEHNHPALGSTLRKMWASRNQELSPLPDMELGISPMEIFPEDRIGAYRITRELGSGGMGTVFLGERADGQHNKKVAIKLLKHQGFISQAGKSRFALECRILSNLQHPHVVQLLDSGIHASGSFYFIMDFIDGSPITRYCRDQSLGLEQRLRLFLQLCDAVSFAHQNLVVHRDLKPGNVLVGKDGRVKLLDFGIAKVIEDNAAIESPTLTETGHILGTPGYSAPEQFFGGMITTKTDVYSLGALLYEMLTGFKALEGLSGQPFTSRQALFQKEPPAPSKRIRHEAKTLDGGTVGLFHQQDEPENQPPTYQITRDIDAIVLKCLRPEPEHRFRSVEELGTDVQNYLDGYPVAARNGSHWYRLGKFNRRHFGKIALVTGLVLATILFITSLQAKNRRIESERRSATQVTDFLISLFQSADPTAGREEELTISDLMERGRARLLTQTENPLDPSVRARLLTTMGTVFTHLGHFDKSDALLGEAIQIFDEIDATEQGQEAQIHYVELHLARAQHQEAEQLLETLFHQIKESSTSDQNPRAAYLHLLKGDLFLATGNFTAAEVQLSTAEQALKKGGAHNAQLRLKLLKSRSRLYHYTDRNQEGLTISMEIVELAGKTFGTQSYEYADALAEYGSNLASKGRLEEGKTVLKQALDLKRAVYGGNHPGIIPTLQNLAVALDILGRNEEAKAYYLESIEVTQQFFGVDHPNHAILLFNYAVFHQNQGQYDQAIDIYQDVLAIREKIFEADHPHIADTYQGIAYSYYMSGNYAKAVEYFQIALEKRTVAYGLESPRTLNSLSRLSISLQKLGRLEEAEIRAREYTNLARIGFGQTHALTLRALLQEADLYLAASKYGQALERVDQALAIIAQGKEPRPEQSINALGAKACALAGLGRNSEADAVMEETLTTAAALGELDQKTRENLVQKQTLLSEIQKAADL